MRYVYFSLCLLFLSSSVSLAQPRNSGGARVYVGVGTGYGFGPGYYGRGFGYPGFGYPGFGFFPGEFNGFYSNGLSGYGPPVITGAPIPGYFGGSDQRYFNRNSMFYPGASVGVIVPLNRKNTQSNWEHEPPLFWQEPSVRPLPNLEAHELEPTKESNRDPNELPVPQSAPSGDPASMTLEIIVPSAAVVKINELDTKQSGVVRIFQSPPLKQGESFTYEVEATWDAKGTPIRQRRELIVKAGDRKRIDFLKPEIAR